MGIGAIGSVLGGIGSLASAGNAIAGGGGSGTGGYYSGTSPPPVYIPSGQPTADAQYQQLATQMGNYANQANANVYNLTSNPYGLQSYIPGYQNAANAAGSYGAGTLTPMQQGGAASLYGAGNTVLNTAFDPQLALYNRTAQQTQDQANAINAMYGLSSSPYGAGVANQAMTNFNIDWQNQQLARQAQGIQSAGQGYAGASGLGSTAMQTALASGQLPYQTYAQTQGDQLNTLSTGQGIDANTLNALAAYLRLGQSATATGQYGSQINFGQNQALGQAVGQGINQLGSGLSTLFGGGPSAAWGNNYANSVDTLNQSGYYGPTDASGGLLYGD